jgi:hypothetical protein
VRVARGSPKNTRKSKKGEVDTDSEHSSLHSSDIDPSDSEPSDYIPRGRREEIRATRRRSSKDDASRTATLYAFSPARHGSWSASAQDHRSAAKPSPEENEDYFSSKRGERPQKPGKVSEIYESRYTGDACPGGGHSAKLTVVKDTKRPCEPLFRWMYEL